MSHGSTHLKKHNKKKNQIKHENICIYPNHEYNEKIGEITGTLGYCNFNIKLLNDDIEIQAKLKGDFISGKSKKKERVNIHDYVLVQPGISKNSYYIVHKYSKTDEKYLLLNGHVKKINSCSIEKDDIMDDENEVKEVEEISLDVIGNIYNDSNHVDKLQDDISVLNLEPSKFKKS